jgi:shikimate kinase
MEKAKALYDERQQQYLKVADIIIDVTDKEVDAIAKEILKKVKK